MGSEVCWYVRDGVSFQGERETVLLVQHNVMGGLGFVVGIRRTISWGQKG